MQAFVYTYKYSDSVKNFIFYKLKMWKTPVIYLICISLIIYIIYSFKLFNVSDTSADIFFHNENMKSTSEWILNSDVCVFGKVFAWLFIAYLIMIMIAYGVIQNKSLLDVVFFWCTFIILLVTIVLAAVLNKPLFFRIIPGLFLAFALLFVFIV